MTRKTPVVVGVGDYVNRSKKVEDALEPLELILRAINLAFQDTGLSSTAAAELQAQIDSIDVVKTWVSTCQAIGCSHLTRLVKTWPYPDLPSLIVKRLGIKPQHRYYSDHGGNQPGKLFDEAARRISRGETNVAVLSGGEALASRKSPTTQRSSGA